MLKNIDYVLTYRAKMNEAPKDVVRLEWCKPKDVKGRKERYQDLIEKEKKEYYGAVLPMSEKEKAAQKEQEPKTEKRKKKKKVKAPKNTQEVLQEEDTLKEGFQWSDEE